MGEDRPWDYGTIVNATTSGRLQRHGKASNQRSVKSTATPDPRTRRGWPRLHGPAFLLHRLIRHRGENRAVVDAGPVPVARGADGPAGGTDEPGDGFAMAGDSDLGACLDFGDERRDMRLGFGEGDNLVHDQIIGHRWAGKQGLQTADYNCLCPAGRNCVDAFRSGTNPRGPGIACSDLLPLNYDLYPNHH